MSPKHPYCRFLHLTVPSIDHIHYIDKRSNGLSIIIDKTDLTKRKRIKNSVPLCDKCCALRANGEQCSRRRKPNEKFCGTHVKGIPHGEINNEPPKKTHKEIQIWIQEIHGINYYIDNNNNVYDYNDIINNKSDPRIVAHYIKTANEYSIPELNNAHTH